jgi:hypothetical protein
MSHISKIFAALSLENITEMTSAQDKHYGDIKKTSSLNMIRSEHCN